MLSCETCLRIWLFKTVCKTFKKKHEFEKPCFWSKHCFFDKEPTFSPVFGCLFRWDVLSISQSICGNFQRICQERLSYSWIPWAFQAGFIRFSGQPCSGPLWDVHSCGGFYDHVMWLYVAGVLPMNHPPDWISGWCFGTWILFFYILINNNPICLILFRGVVQPPTRYVSMYNIM